MATIIDELLIAVGADISGAIDGLKKVEKTVTEMAGGVTGAAGAAGAAVSGIGAQGAAGLGAVGEAAGKAKKELEEAAKQGSKAFGSMGKTLDAVGSKLRSMAAPLLAAFGTQKLFSGYVGQADELGMLSKRLKISVEDIDAWSQANVAAGGSADSLRQSLKAYYDATGRPAEEFFKLGEKIEGMTDRQKMAYLRAQGVAWDAIPVFLKGQKEADRLVAKYRQTAFTAEDGERARAFRVAWQDFGRAAQAVGNVLARFVLPPLTAALDLLARAVAALASCPPLLGAVGVGLTALFGGRIVGGLSTVIKLFGGYRGKLSKIAVELNQKIPRALKAALTAVLNFGAGMKKAILALGGIVGIMKGIGAAVLAFIKSPLKTLRTALGAAGLALRAFGASAWAATGPIGLIAAAVIALGLVLEDLYTFFSGGDSIFGRVLAQYVTPEELKAVKDGFVALWDALKSLWDIVKPGIIEAFVVALKFCLSILNGLVGVLAVVAAAVVKLWNFFANPAKYLRKAWDAVKTWASDICKTVGRAIGDAAADLAGWISDAAGELFDAVKQWIDELKQWFSGLIDAVPDIGSKISESISNAFTDALASAREFFESIGSLIAEKVKAPFKEAFSGIKDFLGVGDDAGGVRVGDREKETVLQRFGLNRSSTVNTNASVNVVNNIQTQDNPAAIGQAVGRTLQPAGMRMGDLIGMSTSGVFLKGG